MCLNGVAMASKYMPCVETFALKEMVVDICYRHLGFLIHSTEHARYTSVGGVIVVVGCRRDNDKR